MKTEPLDKEVIHDTQPLSGGYVAGAAAAKQTPDADQPDIDRKSGAVDYQSAAGSQPEEDSPALFDQDALESFRSRWGTIQTGFVDDPGGAVKQADELVAVVMKRLEEVFANERASLEQAWARGDDVSTEDLRVALRRYRAFFDHLLSV
jgi:hypothetical protein